MLGAGAAGLADHRAGRVERLAHQCLVGHSLGNAAREQVGIRSPGFQSGLLVGSRNTGVVEADRGPVDSELARHAGTIGLHPGEFPLNDPVIHALDDT